MLTIDGKRVTSMMVDGKRIKMLTYIDEVGKKPIYYSSRSCFDSIVWNGKKPWLGFTAWGGTK